MPGDGILLGGIGACLGPLGLAWALIAGAALSIAYRSCLQRKRRRPFTAGYTPLGPGMAGGALLVLALVASVRRWRTRPHPSSATYADNARIAWLPGHFDSRSRHARRDAVIDNHVFLAIAIALVTHAARPP